MKEELEERATEAYLVVAGGVAGVGEFLFGWFDVLLEVSNILFAIVSVLGSQIVPMIDWIDQSTFAKVLVVFGGLYGIHLLIRLIKKLRAADPPEVAD